VIYPEEQPQELLISLLFSGEKSPKGDTVFWKGNILSQIPLFWKLNSLNCNRKMVFWGGGCIQIHASVIHIYAFSGKESPVKLKSTKDAQHSGSIRELKRKHCSWLAGTISNSHPILLVMYIGLS
jgi:hypothetical protein